jgi:predicted DNA-binding transcriptional regulator YafY
MRTESVRYLCQAADVPQTTQRVLSLLSLLQSRPVWTGPELAERLDVTTRSIRRDVQRLRDLGYPVLAAQGVGGGYQLGAGRALPPLLLDDEEAVAIAVSLRLGTAATLRPGSGDMNEVALRTLAKLDQVLPARLRNQVRAVHASTASLERATDEIGLDQLLVLARACWATERVRFGYLASDGASTRRRVEPYRVVSAARHWYLMGYDLDREDWRTFRLDRMAELASTGSRFRPRPAPDPVEYVRAAIAVGPYRFTARAVVHAPYAELVAQVPPAAATIERLDGSRCLLVAGGEDLELMAWHLARLPYQIEVLEPAELREAAGVLARRLTAIT